MALTKVSGGILDPGINVAGIVTATGFDGPFTGGSGSNITAGILTATGLDVNGNGDISGNLVVGGNLTANGDFTTLNTTLREVELLRVDANNDSVAAGIITQTGAGNILSLYDGVAELFTVADGGNVTIKNITGTPNFNIQGTNASATAESNLNFLLRDGNSADRTVAKIAARNTGNGGYGALDFYTAFNNTNIRRMSIHHSGNVGIGSTLPDYPLDVAGSIGFSGQTRGLTQSASSPTYSFDGDSDTGMYRGNGVNILSFATAGLERLSISATGVASFTGDVGVGTGTTMETSGQFTTVSNIKISANSNNHSATARLQLGADQNFEIYHNASRDNIIDVDRGNLVIKNSGSDLPHGSAIINRTDGQFLVANQAQNKYRIKAYDGGAVQLFHNNNLRLETDANGVQIKPNAGGVTQLGIAQTTTTAYSINGTISFINSSNTTAQIRGRTGIGTTTGDIIFLCNAVGDETLAVLEDGKVRVPDRGSFVVGQGNDLTLRHDGDHSTITNITGNLTVTNSGYTYIDQNYFRVRNAAGNHMIEANTAGADQGVQLFHAPGTAGNGVLKTTGIGITVTGKVVASGEVETAQDYPNFRPRLDLNFAAEKKLDPRITYRRTGSASFTDEFGKVVLVGGNAPRFDHDPVIRESKGLLIEESRTNYVRVSTNLASEWQAGSGSFAVDNSITNPDGSVGAYYHTGAELYHQDIDLSGASTNTVIVSLWVKERSGQSGNLDIQIYQQITGSVVNLGGFSFNPATEAISLTSNYSNGTVEEYPNGWYRVSAKLTTASGNFTSSTRYDMQNAEHYVWGMQLEVGSFVTSFIPTNGSTATRGADIVEIEEEDFSDFYNQNEGTIMLSASFNSDNRTSAIVTIDDTSNSSEYTEVGYRAGGGGSNSVGAYLRTDASGDQYYKAFASSATAGSEFKVAFGYKDSDYASSANGQTVHTDTSGTTSKVYDRLRLSVVDTVDAEGSGHYRRLVYYGQRLPNNQLVTLTS